MTEEERKEKGERQGVRRNEGGKLGGKGRDAERRDAGREGVAGSEGCRE